MSNVTYGITDWSSTDVQNADKPMSILNSYAAALTLAKKVNSRTACMQALGQRRPARMITFSKGNIFSQVRPTLNKYRSNKYSIRINFTLLLSFDESNYWSIYSGVIAARIGAKSRFVRWMHLKYAYRHNNVFKTEEKNLNSLIKAPTNVKSRGVGTG